jgi:hypothetical protein
MGFFNGKESEFVERSANLIAGAKKYRALLALPEDQLTALETLHNEFAALHAKCRTAASGKQDTQAKNDKKKVLVKTEGIFIRNHLQNNDNMTDVIRVELGLPVHDTNPTPNPKPDVIPATEVSAPWPRTVRIRFRAENAPRWGKPKGVHGLECLWTVLDTLPAQIKDLPHSSFATKNPLDLAFNENERGSGCILRCAERTGQ